MNKLEGSWKVTDYRLGTIEDICCILNHVKTLIKKNLLKRHREILLHVIERSSYMTRPCTPSNLKGGMNSNEKPTMWIGSTDPCMISQSFISENEVCSLISDVNLILSPNLNLLVVEFDLAGSRLVSEWRRRAGFLVAQDMKLIYYDEYTLQIWF